MENDKAQILREFRRLNQRLGDLTERLAQQIEAVCREKKEQRNEGPVEPITIKFTDEYAKRQKDCQAGQYDIQKSLRNWTRGATIVAGVYALITLWIWLANKKAADAAKVSADAANRSVTLAEATASPMKALS